MAEVWVTVPLDQLVGHHDHDGVRARKRCALCNAQTVPGTDQEIEEQIRIHLQRRHLTVLETSRGRLPARMRAKLIAQGWTPPSDEEAERLEREARAPNEPPGGRSSVPDLPA